MTAKQIFKDKYICIIGAGLLQLPAVLKARAYDAYVVVLDMDPQALAVEQADFFIQCSTMDAEAASLAVEKFSREQHSLDAVFTVGTDASYTVALCAERLGLPGITPESAVKATNKFVMRQSLDEHGVRVPRYYQCQDIDQSIQAFNKITHSCVIKPLLNMGARGVQRVDTEQELRQAWRDSFQYSRTGRLLIEQYIDGPELSIDALIHEGEVTITGIADRIIQYPPYFVETGHIMPSQLPEEMQNQAVSEMKRAIKALGLTTGAAKGDIRVNSSGAWIGELAARLSGGFMSAYTYPLSSGVDLIANAMAIALGHAPFDLEPVRQWVSIEQAVMAAPGVITAIHGLEKAKNLPYIEHIFMGSETGDRIAAPRNNMDKCGHIIAAAPTLEQAEQSIYLAQQEILISVK